MMSTHTYIYTWWPLSLIWLCKIANIAFFLSNTCIYVHERCTMIVSAWKYYIHLVIILLKSYSSLYCLTTLNEYYIVILEAESSNFILVTIRTIPMETSQVQLTPS